MLSSEFDLQADPQLLAIRLRQATNLTATIGSTIAMHASVVSCLSSQVENYKKMEK